MWHVLNNTFEVKTLQKFKTFSFNPLGHHQEIIKFSVE